MANYDPNDPRRTDATDPHRPVDPSGRNNTVVTETYVEPVEKKASPLPLIIGILLALALAWWLLSSFMGDDKVVETDTATTTTTTTAPAPAMDPAPATVDTTVVEETVTTEPEAAADAAADAAGAAAQDAGEAAQDAAAATGAAADAAADAAAEAASDAADAASGTTPAPVTPAPSN